MIIDTILRKITLSLAIIYKSNGVPKRGLPILWNNYENTIYKINDT